jgi:exodeoxyribonuclease V alpha subunit
LSETSQSRSRGAKKPDGPEETVEGTVERILFSNQENSYTVAAIRPAGAAPSSKVEYTIVGNLGALQPQEVVQLRGHWINDKKYGRQFKVQSYTSVLPSTASAMEKYLGSGLIKGIGKTYAKKLVETFGADIFDIIEHDPARLREVPNIGKKRLDMITKGWHEHRAMREIMLFLQQHNITQGLATRIYRHYGDEALAQIRRNPYQLALDVRGIGFKSADAMAQKLGIPVDSSERCKAGVHFLLQDMASDGHTYFPADPLIQKAQENLGVAQELIVQGVNALKSEGHVVLELLPDETRAVYLSHLHRHESGVAEHLDRLLCTGKLYPKMDGEASINEFEVRHKFKLADNQRLAVMDALKGGVQVITGGPGTGKTTIIRTILRILTAHGISVVLAAPTGRAAKRMQEITNIPASTIHRLLQYSPQEGKYLRNPQNPIRADFLIIDECSMIDVALAHSLLRAAASTSSIIFVGDVDQLPSVGPGNFLLDMIRSGVVPVVRLNEVFRQAQSSLIVTNAHRINQGLPPSFAPGDGEMKRDFYFFDAETPEKVLETVRDLVRNRIPSKFGFNARDDVQVLSAMHRGVIGAQNMNKEMQAILNPGKAGVERSGVLFRTGDKVMQTSNDYDKDVYNGDIGIISSIDPEDQVLRVNFDGRHVTYDFQELDALELAYCITIHKSQGSEYKAVVIPVHTTQFVMLQKNLLYTGITRGKKLVCLVGQKRAVMMAVQNVSAEPRFSSLHLKLQTLRKRHVNPREL